MRMRSHPPVVAVIVAGLARGAFLIALAPSVQAQHVVFGRTDVSGGGKLALADFNLDGKLDLVRGTAVSPGNGDGTFAAPLEPGDPGCCGVISYVVPGDFNGDGKPDLVVTKSEGVLVFLPGKGDGTFGAHSEMRLGEALASGDFNGDGKLDLLGTGILLGHGDGTFELLAGSPSGHAAGDFNGDGNLDIAISGSEIQVRLGLGNGSFQPAITSSYPGSAPAAIVAGDFDRDGKADIVGVDQRDYHTPSTVSVLFSQGDGTFRTAGVYDAARVEALSVSVAAGDVNGDGALDLVADALTPARTSTIAILFGRGDGTFGASRFETGSGPSPGAMAAGDLNGDGKTDLALTDTTENTVSILISQGDGSFQARRTLATGRSPLGVTLADLSGDGQLDLAVTNQDDSTVSTWLGDGDGTFQSRADTPAGASPRSVAAVDFDGDGRRDLVVANATTANKVSVLLGHGDGTFQTRRDFTTGPEPLSLAAGHFNADGILDLVAPEFAAGWGFTVTVLYGRPDGAFANPLRVEVGQGPLSLAAADLSGDGKDDIAVANWHGYSRSATVLPARGDGAFMAPVEFRFREGAAAVAIGDFNGDGARDLAVADISPALTVFLNLPIVAVTPIRLTFDSQAVGTTSDAQPVKLTNITPVPIQLSAIAVSGEFTATHDCPTTLSPGKSCTLQVAFAPKGAGGRTGSITITDSAVASPHTVSLAGTGLAAPVISLSPASLSFGNQFVGITSAPQTVALRNTGVVSLTISSISISQDYGLTHNCGSSVDAGSGCTLDITFTPKATGVLQGTLTIADNVAGISKTVILSGTGTDFGVSAGSGSSTSATVTAGQTAIYTLALSGSPGFSGTVTLRCTGAPQLTTCTINPTALVLTGTSIANATVRVTTTSRSTTVPGTHFHPPRVGSHGALPFLACMLALGLLIALASSHGGDRSVPTETTRLGLGAAILFVLLWTACGGGGEGGRPGAGSPGTPRGTYTLTVTSESATLKHDLKLTLTVL